MHKMNPSMLFAVIIVATVFVFVVSIGALYVRSQIEGTIACGCAFPLELLIPVFASAGVLVGSILFYILSSHKFSEGKRKDYIPLLKLLEKEQSEVLGIVAKSGGRIAQSRLVDATGYNKVKISRVIKDLEARGIINKRASGITNIIELEPQLKKLLCE